MYDARNVVAAIRAISVAKSGDHAVIRRRIHPQGARKHGRCLEPAARPFVQGPPWGRTLCSTAMSGHHGGQVHHPGFGEAAMSEKQDQALQKALACEVHAREAPDELLRAKFRKL